MDLARFKFVLLHPSLTTRTVHLIESNKLGVWSSVFDERPTNFLRYFYDERAVTVHVYVSTYTRRMYVGLRNYDSSISVRLLELHNTVPTLCTYVYYRYGTYVPFTVPRRCKMCSRIIIVYRSARYGYHKRHNGGSCRRRNRVELYGRS